MKDRRKLYREMVGNDHFSQSQSFNFDGVDKTQDETLKMIFAPDPLTGCPRSDLAIIMSKDSRPEISEFIRNTLMQPLGKQSRTENPDDAIELTRSRGETLQAYGDRLKAIVQKYNKKDDKK